MIDDVKERRRMKRRRQKHCGSWTAGARERACAGGTWVNCGIWSVWSLGHLPSCLFGGGLCPCAGYFSLDLELVSVVLIEPKPQQAHTPTSCQPFGR